MYMRLNFADNTQLKQFLMRDKHKLLEGLVVEELFISDIVEPIWEEWFSKGWWAIKDPRRRSNYLFFHVSDYFPNSSDKRVYSELLKRRIPIVHVKFQENYLYFLEITEQNISSIRKQEYLNEEKFKSQYNCKIKQREIFIAKAESRDSVLQKRAISFFEKNQKLKDTTIQRYFANYFLYCYFTKYIVNIDAFITFPVGGLNLVEIKFKYPFNRHGSLYYGINDDQSILLKWALNSNIKVLHYIAKNPSYSKELDVFDILTTPGLEKEFFWESHELIKDDLNHNNLTAPKETNMEGNKTQQFKPILASSFKRNSQVASTAPWDFSGITKRTCSNCGSNLVPTNGKYGYFLGCSNWKECKKQIK